MVTFEPLVLGNKYSRPTLAKLWGYKSFNAISRGVFSPQGFNTLTFFVTKEKQETLTQYEDHMMQTFSSGKVKRGMDLIRE